MMSNKASKGEITLEVTEPVISHSNYNKPLFSLPKELFEHEWTIYKLPNWVCDHCSKKCMLCDVNFTFMRRRHHCRGCGGIYCSSCSLHFLPLPQFNVNTPQRLCNACLEKQKKIFILKKESIKLKQKLLEQEEKVDLLHQLYSKILQSGSNFTKYDSYGVSERKLIFSDDLETISEINLKTNTIAYTFNVNDINLKKGLDVKIIENQKNRIRCSQDNCFTILYHDEVFVYESNSNEVNVWFEGTILAKLRCQLPKIKEAYKLDISDITVKITSLVKAQTDFAISKLLGRNKKDTSLVEISQNNILRNSSDNVYRFQPPTNKKKSFVIKENKKHQNSIIQEVDDILN